MSAKRVLIADDDLSLARALGVRFEGLGLEVSVATDGLEAIQILVQQRPDLIVLDIHMGAADGLSACERIVRDDRFCGVPVVLMTGDSKQHTIRRCEELGAHYLFKGPDLWEKLRDLALPLLQLPPLADTQEGAPETGADPDAEAGPGPASNRVLLVDDDPAFTKALALRLTALGVESVRAFNGTQGYWMALKVLPSVVVTDFKMPEGYGNYLLGRLKDHPLTRDIPVIVLTGRTIGGRKDFALERELRSLGACAYFTKPLDFDAFVRELQRWMVVPALTPVPMA